MSIRKTLAVLLTAGTVAAFGLSAKPAHADLIPTLIGSPVLQTSGNYVGDYLFTYKITLTDTSYVGGGTPPAGPDQTLDTFNSQVTLYDVLGVVPQNPPNGQLAFGVSSNPNLIHIGPTAQNVGPLTPTNPPIASDDPGIVNLVFTIGQANNIKYTGNIDDLFEVSFYDQYGNINDLDGYGGQTSKNSTGNTNGTPQVNFGFVSLPSITTQTTTPEPASYAAFLMGGLGLLGLGLKARRKTAA